MANQDFLNGYLSELAVMATVTGIVFLIGDKLEGGMGKFITIACSLVVVFYVITPLYGFFKENSFVTDGTVTATDIPYENYEQYYQHLTKKTLENLKNSATKYINNKYSLDEEAYCLNFEGEIRDESFVVICCNFTVKDLKVLLYRQDIEEYIKDNYGCECVFIEDIL